MYAGDDGCTKQSSLLTNDKEDFEICFAQRSDAMDIVAATSAASMLNILDDLKVPDGHVLCLKYKSGSHEFFTMSSRS